MELSTSSLQLAEECPASPRAYASLGETAPNGPMLRGLALHLAFQRMVESNSPELTAELEAECKKLYPELTQVDLDDASASYFGFMARKPNVGMLGASEVLMLLEPELDVDWLGLKSEVRKDGQRSNRGDAAWVVPGFFAILWENKFGVGHGVFEVPHPKVNRQIQTQAVSLAKKYQLESVHAFLCQPKVWTGRPLLEHVFDFEGLELVEAQLKGLVLRARQPEAPFLKGEHCRKCAAAASCPARQDKPMVPDPRVMSLPEYLASLSTAQRGRLADDLVAFRDWAEDSLEVLQKNAPTLPVEGWGLVEGKKAALAWVEEVEARKALKRAAKIVGLKESDVLGPITPSQALKLFSKSEEAEALVNENSDRPASKMSFRRLEAA